MQRPRGTPDDAPTGSALNEEARTPERPISFWRNVGEDLAISAVIGLVYVVLIAVGAVIGYLVGGPKAAGVAALISAAGWAAIWWVVTRVLIVVTGVWSFRKIRGSNPRSDRESGRL